MRIRVRDSLENRVDRECRRIPPTDVLGRVILHKVWRFRRVSHHVDGGFEFDEASGVFVAVASLARLIPRHPSQHDESRRIVRLECVVSFRRARWVGATHRDDVAVGGLGHRRLNLLSIVFQTDLRLKSEETKY